MACCDRVTCGFIDVFVTFSDADKLRIFAAQKLYWDLTASDFIFFDKHD